MDADPLLLEYSELLVTVDPEETELELPLEEAEKESLPANTYS